MPKFLVLYRSSLTAREQMSAAGPEGREASMGKWIAWMQRSGDAITDMGSPLDVAQRVGGASAPVELVTGYSIIESDSSDAARLLVDGHPHLEGPGDDSIDLLEMMSPGSE
jgi:hypothetical protein